MTIEEGQIVLLRFPQTDALRGKLRPALVLRRVPGPHADWLLCMISSRLDQGLEGLDEVILADEADFAESGLKCASVIRISRVAVASASMLLGAIGRISPSRLDRIRSRLSEWLPGR